MMQGPLFTLRKGRNKVRAGASRRRYSAARLVFHEADVTGDHRLDEDEAHNNVNNDDNNVIST